MKHYRFEFEGGVREADGEDVVRALAAVLKEMGGPEDALKSPLGWLNGFTETRPEDQGQYIHECMRCRRSWRSLLAEPKACRWCGSKLWMTEWQASPRPEEGR